MLHLVRIASLSVCRCSLFEDNMIDRLILAIRLAGRLLSLIELIIAHGRTTILFYSFTSHDLLMLIEYILLISFIFQVFPK